MKYAISFPMVVPMSRKSRSAASTPLQAANVPDMDAIVAAGVVGRANNVPPSLPAGSDVANLSLLGYDPLEHFTGRAPLEAAAQGIPLGPDDWAIRCNLVTVEDQMMRSFTAGHISTEEATRLLATAQEQLGGDRAAVRARRQLSQPADLSRGEATRRRSANDTRATPPHDLTDKSVLDDYPRGPGSDLLDRPDEPTASALFADHPVNAERNGRGKLPATNIWLWGQGSAPALKSFQELYGKRGAMITAVDLLRGLAALVGWERIEVPGATGYLDTDYAAKGRYAIDALDRHRRHLRACRSDRRSVARRTRRRQDQGARRDRREHRRPAARGPEEARRLPHSRLARPSDAAAHQDAQPRLRAVGDLRHRRRARRRDDLRRSRRRRVDRWPSTKAGR